MTDPVADMLTRIRNAAAVNQHQVTLPYSKLKESIATQLKSSRFIDNVSTSGAGINKNLLLIINAEGSQPRITEIKRLSRPGKRAYARSGAVPVIKRGRGIVIVSTSKGLMTGDQAIKQHLGGELICEVY